MSGPYPSESFRRLVGHGGDGAEIVETTTIGRLVTDNGIDRVDLLKLQAVGADRLIVVSGCATIAFR